MLRPRSRDHRLSPGQRRKGLLRRIRSSQFNVKHYGSIQRSEQEPGHSVGSSLTFLALLGVFGLH